MSEVHSTVANFVVFNIEDVEELHPIKCKGVYFGDGRMEITLPPNLLLEIDPARYYPRDPKRCIVRESNQWSNYRIKSCLLNSKAIRKEA